MSEMDVFNRRWSKVFLNDTTELVKRNKNNPKKYNRRLFSKMKNSPVAKPKFYRKYLSKPISSPADEPVKKSKLNIGNQWKKEYDVWNMIVQSIDQNLSDKHKVNWVNKEIGVRNGDDKVQLIQHRDDLDKQILISSNGKKAYLKDLMNPNDSSDNISLNIKFKLVPIVEKISIVNKCSETSYKFAENDNEINNNIMDIKMENNSYEFIENVPTLMNSYDSLCSRSCCNTSEFIDSIGSCSTLMNTIFTSSDRTLTNSTCTTWDYSEFCYDIMPDASSTFISDAHGNMPLYSLDEKENIPLISNDTADITALSAPIK